jgi:lipid-A-disaccharide synthase
MPRICIVTGEASGDVHGANLARAIRELRPDAELIGVGGSRMQAAGVAVLPGLARTDVIGVTMGWNQIRVAVGNFLALARFLRRTRLDAVVFIDNPGMNLRLARIARWAGQKVIYYIAPQVWAWAPIRMRLIRRRVHHVVVILPFEEALYRAAGVTCTFVGHPLLDEVAPSYDRDALRKQYGLKAGAPVVGLLPGSRESEVRALFPVMLQAGKLLRQAHPGVQFIMAQAPSITDDLVAELSDGAAVPVRVVRDQASEVMAASDVLLVASGTATLQAAVVGTPMVLTYRAAWLNYRLAKLLVRIPWIGLANIVAGRGIVTELLQHAATPERMSEEVSRLLSDARAADTMRTELKAVRESLGTPGASRRAADVVLAECGA